MGLKLRISMIKTHYACIRRKNTQKLSLLSIDENFLLANACMFCTKPHNNIEYFSTKRKCVAKARMKEKLHIIYNQIPNFVYFLHIFLSLFSFLCHDARMNVLFVIRKCMYVCVCDFQQHHCRKTFSTICPTTIICIIYAKLLLHFYSLGPFVLEKCCQSLMIRST